MTKAAALYKFFSSFGISAYVSTSVPDDAEFPRLTYELVTSAFDGGEVSCTVNLWYKSDTEIEPNAKAQEIADKIGIGGKVIPCEDGYIWIKRGSPWCQSIADDNDLIKRRYINVTLEYLTTN